MDVLIHLLEGALLASLILWGCVAVARPLAALLDRAFPDND